jgi:pimeloyl-ACP methyl ester carboxylesterase
VRIQYLDYGGTGPVVVFLPGWGSTAHIFDDLAPRFADRFHVLALTPRGFGESEAPTSGYSLTRYADDLVGLLKEVGAERASFVAHSYSGWVLTRLARLQPARVQRAVFLDSAYDLAGADSVIGRRPFERPSTSGIRSNTEYFDWLTKYFYGFWSPALEADAAINAVNWDHRAAQPALDEARGVTREWAAIAAPSLAICSVAAVESEFPWIASTSPDYAVARRYIEEVRRPFQRSECRRFASTVRNARTIELNGGHFLFVNRSMEVAQSIRAFLDEIR